MHIHVDEGTKAALTKLAEKKGLKLASFVRSELIAIAGGKR